MRGGMDKRDPALTASMFAMLSNISAMLGCLLDEQRQLKECIVATYKETKDDLDDIKNAVAALPAKFDDLKAQIQALKDQIAAGTPVSQADLDVLDAEAEEIKASLAALSAPAEPPV